MKERELLASVRNQQLTIGMEKLKYLSGYEHVAWFQRFMGVDSVDIEKLHANGETKDNKSSPPATPDIADDGQNGKSHNGVHRREVVVTNGAVHVNGKVHRLSSFKNGVHNPDTKEMKLAYKINNKPIYYLMKFGASLGDELFYIVFFPFMCWNVDFRLTRQMCMIWYLVMYLGQFLKDCIQWPRPGPPAVRLEGNRFQLEYGMPSTHTIVGTCIPFSLLYLTSKYYEYPYYIGLVISIAWTLLVACSRVYLGMHTVLDCIVGISMTAALLPWMLANVESWDYFQVTSPYAPFMYLIPFLACLFYPKAKVWSVTRGDTSNIVSIGVCIGVSAWLAYHLGWMTEMPHSTTELLPFPAITKKWIMYSLVRTIVGVAALASSRIVSKKIFTKLTCYCVGVDPSDIARQRELGLEVPIIWLTIGGLAINTAFTAPIIFYYLGINRPGYYFEVGV